MKTDTEKKNTTRYPVSLGKTWSTRNWVEKCYWFMELGKIPGPLRPWWRHQMETFSALLAICARNSTVPGEFPAQRPVTRSFDVFFDLRLNKRLSKQSLGWWFETPSLLLWHHCNEIKLLLVPLTMITKQKDCMYMYVYLGFSLTVLPMRSYFLFFSFWFFRNIKMDLCFKKCK